MLTGRPYFISIKRNDVFDLSVGFKILLGEQGLIFVNALLPLNQDGVRVDVAPTVGFEYNFGT